MCEAKRKILVTIPVTDAQREELAAAGGEDCILTFLPADFLTEEILAEQEAVIGNIPADRLALCRDLRWVQLNSAGADPYGNPGVLPESCILTTAVGAYGLTVSEHMLAQTFALIRRFGQYARNQQQHIWRTEGQIISVEGSVVLILGLGDIGGSYARKMKALGAYTIGLRRSKAERPDYLDEQYTMEALDEILPRADIVAMVLPGGPETFRLIDAARISRMKDGAYLLNAGRGTSVDQEALLQALTAGKLGGAALDVTDPEPLPADHPFWDLDNLLLTPHAAGKFFLPETLNRIIHIAAGNLRAYLAGEAMRNVTEHR